VTNHKNLRVPIIDGFDSNHGPGVSSLRIVDAVLPGLGVAIEF